MLYHLNTGADAVIYFSDALLGGGMYFILYSYIYYILNLFEFRFVLVYVTYPMLDDSVV